MLPDGRKEEINKVDRSVSSDGEEVQLTAQIHPSLHIPPLNAKSEGVSTY